MHFFSPVPVMPLVELVRGTATTDATADTVRALSADLGKQVIVSADRPGFIVNRMLMPFLAEAMRAFEEGVGSADDIDAGARIGLNHPMGPLALADFIGLDVCKGIMEVLHEGFGEERFAPPRVLVELVESGHLGQKTGRGFHDYPKGRRASSPGSPATVRSTLSMSNGFASSGMPRASATSRSSGFVTSPVMNANRPASAGAIFATASLNAAPLIAPIRWSQRIASGGSSRTIASAAAPSPARTGSWPIRRRIRARNSRIAGSSSTTRIRAGAA